MKQWATEIKMAIKNLIKYIFRSEDERITKLVEIYRKKYEKYDIAKLQDMLIGYKSKVQQSQLLLTGIMLAMFTALLGGLGQSILHWIRQVLIVSTSATLKKAQSLTNADLQTVLFIEFFVLAIIILILVLGLVFFIDKIKTTQMKILILENIIEKKTRNEKNQA